MVNDELTQKCILLGALRVFAIKNVLDTIYPDDEFEDKKMLEIYYQNIAGILTISSSIGLTISDDLIFPRFWKAIGIHSRKIDDYVLPDGTVDVNLDNFFSNFIKTIIDDNFRERIREQFGNKYALAFQYSQYLFLTRPLSSLIQQLNLKNVPKERKELILNERNWAVDFIKHFGEIISKEKDDIRIIFGDFLFKDFLKLSETIKNQKGIVNWAAKNFEESNHIANQLVPHYFEILERLNRSKEIAKELKNCPIGVNNWQNYENICIKILRYLFIPPFREIKIQSRSEVNYERRDAIIPNNQHTGFWQQIRNEFDCKHVVIEFKNGVSGNSKNALNQLRIYLSKPTVGKFGLLFLRDKPTKALLQAQRDAYEQSKILILIFDDEKLLKLMAYRSYLGTADDFLSNEKFEFEINY